VPLACCAASLLAAAGLAPSGRLVPRVLSPATSRRAGDVDLGQRLELSSPARTEWRARGRQNIGYSRERKHYEEKAGGALRYPSTFMGKHEAVKRKADIKKIRILLLTRGTGNNGIS